MLRLQITIGIIAHALIAISSAASAQEVLKIGMVQAMTGPLSQAGKAAANGALLYLKQHGDVVAGRKIQLIIKDDGSVPDVAKRLTQELIVNE